MLVVIPSSGPILLSMVKSYLTFLRDAISGNNKGGETLALELIGLILHIFYSLNCVEFPAFFEDTLVEWMTSFKEILELKRESDSLLKCKTRIIKNVTLYCEKYSQDFKDYIPSFFSLIWSQIEFTSMETEFDKVLISFNFA